MPSVREPSPSPTPTPADLAHDAALVEGLVRQDEAAVAGLLDEHWTAAYRVAVGVLGDPGSAEDAAQEAVVRALQGASGFERGRAFRPWFLRIVVNVCHSHRRSETRRVSRESLAARGEVVVASADPLEVRERADVVRGALSGLAPKLREALSLRYLEELSLAEVAETLGCPEGTVSSRVRRGMARLRASLEGVGQPGVQFGAVAGLLLLRQAMQPAAPAAASLLAQAASLPPLPGACLPPTGAALPDLSPAASPEGALEGLGRAAEAVGEGAGAAPPPPPASEVLGLAGAAAREAPHALTQTLAPVAILALLLLIGAGSAVKLLAPDEGGALASASATPQAGASGAPLGGLALAPGPKDASVALELQLPATLTQGDTLSGYALVRWADDDPFNVEVEAELARAVGGAALELRLGDPERRPGAIAWPLHLRALRPGTQTVLVRARGPSGTIKRAERAVAVVGVGRPVSLPHNVELAGPDAKADLTLDPRAASFEEPRRLVLKVIPGLAEEAALSLRGFARQPTGCFEQTTAATYPSALVLAMAAERPVDRSLIAEARTHALAGAKRLNRFQAPNGGFSLHPGEAPDPWLTAVGLAQLVNLAEVVPIDRDRLEGAAVALSRYLGGDGAMAVGPFVSARWPKATLAVTAYASAALHGYLDLPRDSEDESADPDVVSGAAKSLAYLESKTSAKASPLELGLVGRAYLAAGKEKLAAQIVGWLGGAVVKDDGHAHWESEHSTTGGPADVRAVETTAIVAQVLSGVGERELLPAALRWLAKQRRRGTFGGTQATVQALLAFRAAGWAGAEGELVVKVGGHVERVQINLRGGAKPDQRDPSAAVASAPAAPLKLEHVLGGTLPAAIAGVFRRSLREPIQLSFRGTGLLRLQVVAEGTLPPGAPPLEGKGRSETSLEVHVDRPAGGQVGVAQRWRVRLRNRGTARALNPMVELSLPPGFRLVGSSGGLGALTLSKPKRPAALRHFDKIGQGLTLYVRDLQPQERLEIPVDVVPLFAGAFRGGALEIYPYYASTSDHGLSPGVLFTVIPAKTEPVIPPVARAPTRVTKAPTPKTKKPKESKKPEPSVAPGRAAIKVAWDVSTLGPLLLSDFDPQRNDGPLERLLGRALCAAPVSVQDFQRSDRLVGLLRSAKWSGGLPVVAEDYLLAWNNALADMTSGQAKLFPTHAWTSVAQSARPLSATDLLVSGRGAPLSGLTLGGAPFLVSRAAVDVDGAGGLSGPYAAKQAKDGTITLTPRLGFAANRYRAVEVVPVESRKDTLARFDVVWCAPRRYVAGAQHVTVELSSARPGQRAGGAQRSLLLSQVNLPGSLGGMRLVRGADRIVSWPNGKVTLVYAQRDLEPIAQAIAANLSAAGLLTEVRPIRRGDELNKQVVALGVASEGLSGAQRGSGLFRERLLLLGRYAMHHVSGRLWASNAVDEAGYLLYPPRLAALPTRPEQRARVDAQRKRLID